MKLGIIDSVNEQSFKNAAEKGLDFIEFCINGGYDTEEFFSKLQVIKGWIEKYNVGVGSIGRWKANILDENGEINQQEVDIALRLIDAANYLKCGIYVCGCNYIDKLSYFENCSQAIGFFSILLEHAKFRDIKVAAYNCRKMNFVNNPIAWKIIHGHLKELGIKYDPSHAVYNGGDYLKEALEWGDRFYHVHIKGSLMINGERVDDPPAGLDQTDWGSFLSILYAKKYDAGLSIEPHSPNWQGELGEKGVDFTIAYMKSLIL